MCEISLPCISAIVVMRTMIIVRIIVIMTVIIAIVIMIVIMIRKHSRGTTCLTLLI